MLFVVGGLDHQAIEDRGRQKLRTWMERREEEPVEDLRYFSGQGVLLKLLNGLKASRPGRQGEYHHHRVHAGRYRRSQRSS